MSDEITLAEMKDLCGKILEAREKENAATEVAEELGRQTTALEMKFIDQLEKIGEKSFKAHGMNFIKTEKFSVRTPQGDDKIAFMNHLKEIGQFDAMITVNSATLNSWYKSEIEKAKAENEVCVVPGLDMPVSRVTLAVRKT